MYKPTVATAEATFNVTSTTTGVVMWTSWVPMVGAKNLRILRNIQGSTGSPKTDVLYQFAAVKTDEADAWTILVKAQTGDGHWTDDVDISGTTDKMWVRAGLSASAATQAQGSAWLTLMLDVPSRVVSRRTITMEPTVGSTNTVVPLAPPQPLVGMGSVMFLITYAHEGGTSSVVPVYRLITNDTDAGGSWTLLTQSYSWTASQNKNSTLLALADDTTKGFWVPAISYTNTTNSGTLTVTVIAVGA